MTYTLYIVSDGGTRRAFLSNVPYSEALQEAEYYNWRWIDENGFEWRMEIDEGLIADEHFFESFESYDALQDCITAYRNNPTFENLLRLRHVANNLPADDMTNDVIVLLKLCETTMSVYHCSQIHNPAEMSKIYKRMVTEVKRRCKYMEDGNR